jgi:CheY-like chemotaxis protein
MTPIQAASRFDFGSKGSIQNDYVCFDQLSALVIDDIGSMRHAIRNQLQSIGIKVVNMAVDSHNALDLIKDTTYDLILCDYNLNKLNTGQHLLEYLRTENILKSTTIFVMLTAETEYSYVANAAEFSPDDYILKPCSEMKLRSRLERLIDLRTYLKPVLDYLDTHFYDYAITECNKLLMQVLDQRRVIHVLRRKAEAQLKLKNYAQVLETYRRADSIKGDLPWVMLGTARAHHALGDLAQATEIANKLIEKNKTYVAAYELLSKIRIDNQDYVGAYEILNRSAVILPSANRFRSVAQAAFLLGKLEIAKSNVKEAIRLSNGSMVERSGDYLSLAQTMVDMGDHLGAIQTLEKSAKKFGNVGIFGVAKDAILAQAYFDQGDIEKSNRLIARSTTQLGNRKNSFIFSAMGKAALKAGDEMSGLKLLTQAIQFSGKDEKRIIRHVTKSMLDTGHNDKIKDVIDGGKERILVLVEDARNLMRNALFTEAQQKIVAALDIHEENLETLMTAAQLQLLWLKQEGLDKAVMGRAKSYLATLDKLVPKNKRVMRFYNYFNEMVNSKSQLGIVLTKAQFAAI